MSKETLTWLNTQVLVGFTDKRGKAWHYKAESQGDEPNHYTGPIPVDDVLRRLFHWQAVERELFINVPCDPENLFGISGIDEDGHAFQTRPVPGRKAIVRSDTHDVLGIFKDGYQPHQYSEWLLTKVSNLLDDSLAVGSAGLLKGGAQAWVSIEVPENITTPSGVVFRPNLLAATSLDGSLSTTYKRVVTAVVCDNTLSLGLSEGGQALKVKHTRYSTLRLQDARDALALVFETADAFTAEVERLCAQTITEAQWAKVLDALVPVPEQEGRAHSLASSKRDSINNLYRYDGRVTPWAGSAFGVVQAFNTYAHHVANVRGATRVERNASNAILGVTEAADAEVLKVLATV